MPTAKTKPKQGAKAAKTPAKKPAQKITAEEVWAGFDELRKLQAETARQLGDLGNKFGDIAEQMLTPALVEKFEKRTFPFTKINRNVRWKKKEYGLSMELDALLENGTKAMIVEVKSKLKKEYVDEFLDKMEKVRRFADLKGDARHFYGAMAAMTAEKPVVNYALEKGLYMIMPSGENVKITKPVSEKVW